MSSLRMPLVLSAALVACVANEPDGDHHDHEDDVIGVTRQPLQHSDPVSLAVTGSCSTTAVKGLATQLVEEIQCLRPNTMMRIDDIPGLALGSAVFPFLQTPTATALSSAQKARGRTMTINSGLRTLPQQYLLYRWYQTGRCGIGLAAAPGNSNHESAVAIDIEDNAGWRSALQAQGFRWLGASDPVHYDFVGKAAVDLKGLSVEAFQRLWNRNHPDDRIDEDGAYGTDTETRLAKSPVGGFPIGALPSCKVAEPQNAPSTEPGQGAPVSETSKDESGESKDESSDDATPNVMTRAGRLPAVDTPASGCSSSARPRNSLPGALIFVGALAIARRRRRS